MGYTIFSRAFLLKFIDSMPILVQIFSGGGKTLYQNASSTKNRQFNGLDGYLVAIHPDDRDHSFKNWERALTENTPLEQEVRFLSKDNTYRWYSEKIIIVDSMRVGILVDVHELKTKQELGLRLMSDLCRGLQDSLKSVHSTVALLPDENPALKTLKKEIHQLEQAISAAQKDALHLSFNSFTLV